MVQDPKTHRIQVHFASFMDLDHLKHTEIAKHFRGTKDEWCSKSDKCNRGVRLPSSTCRAKSASLTDGSCKCWIPYPDYLQWHVKQTTQFMHTHKCE